MKKKLEKFTVWTPTEFGLGCFKIEAKSFEDAFIRLGKKDKMKDGWIDDEAGETKTFSQILGLEELI